MNQQTLKSTIPILYWLIVAVALLWNLIGLCLSQSSSLSGGNDEKHRYARGSAAVDTNHSHSIYFVDGLSAFTAMAFSIGPRLAKSWATRIVCELPGGGFVADGLHHVHCGWAKGDGAVGIACLG